MTEPGGGIQGPFGGPQRIVLLVIVILVSGIGIGATAFLLFDGQGPDMPPSAEPTTSFPTMSADTVTDTATKTITETTMAKPPPITASPPRPTATSVPRPSVYAARATIIGTCDEGGSCGVKQRSGPYNESPRLHPIDLQDGMVVTAICQTTGDYRANSGVGSTNVWYRLDNGAYVSAVYMTALRSWVPAC